MTRIRSTVFFLSLAALLLTCGAARAQALVHTYFEGTQYPLAVHLIQGDEPGPTVMVQGGIQGDEISGFITAQILTQARVTRGSLIVIPRANVPSISIRARQVNVDLNRRFDRNYNDFYEDRLARVIRHYLARSSAFIHLHEGSGFYSPSWVNSQRNPKRYGQSVIIDTSVYDDRVPLASYVTRVLDRLNPTVVPADYRFTLFNTETFAEQSPYAEQRKSLTCYALQHHAIPALAIEVSKSISDLPWKVRQQLKATVLFLETFGVSAEVPDLSDETINSYFAHSPDLYVNGQRVAPDASAAVTLAPGEPIDVSLGPDGHRLFNPVPALFASDRTEVDLTRSPRLPLAPFRTLEVRSDGRRLGKVRVNWKGAFREQLGGKPVFACWLNGTLRLVPAGRTLKTVEGDQLFIEGVWGGTSDEVVNVKGLVTQPGKNDGQDAGCEIVLDPGTFIARYFLPPAASDEHTCRVVRETPGKKRDEFFIRMVPRRVKAVVLEDERGEKRIIPWSEEGTYSLPPGTYRLRDAWSNGDRDKIQAMANGDPVGWNDSLRIGYGDSVRFVLRQATTFTEIGAMRLTSANLAETSGAPRTTAAN